MKELTAATKMFEKVGFRVIHMLKENFYMLVPADAAEHEKYGHPCISTRAMEGINDYITKRWHVLDVP